MDTITYFFLIPAEIGGKEWDNTVYSRPLISSSSGRGRQRGRWYDKRKEGQVFYFQGSERGRCIEHHMECESGTFISPGACNTPPLLATRESTVPDYLPV
ncbi:hypothetical protein Pcinc_037370 [Petrolisthes cinctipes]|uniref:Uncharacterized protein n=1 Tax=Petrolisthes cinctipes TaxID=88211 RepID=A0AAE1EP12_PETCI|nr:hypothetical protein Pcinc_037370 [Petrolisthes cinctipes]